MYTCASCQIHACVSGDKEKMPKNCPMHNEELMERAKAEYAKPEYRDFYKNSCLVESEGYCQWPRVKEIAEKLNVGEETVKKRKQVAKQVLKEKLGKLYLFLFPLI